MYYIDPYEYPIWALLLGWLGTLAVLLVVIAELMPILAYTSLRRVFSREMTWRKWAVVIMFATGVTVIAVLPIWLDRRVVGLITLFLAYFGYKLSRTEVPKGKEFDTEILLFRPNLSYLLAAALLMHSVIAVLVPE